ncbi:MAG: hypothetical protein H7177_14620 [Rhizobacter sp.]|nr:hypothetical protein [Bacteriovorax sp.]
MKKFLVVCTLFMICLSISRIFPCGQLLNLKEVKRTSPQCSVEAKCSISAEHTSCSAYSESVYDIKSLPALFSCAPTFLGVIFFKDIHIEEKNVIFSLDRPPALIS